MKLHGILAVGFLVFPVTGFAGEKKKLSIDQVPGPVAAAIKAAAGSEPVTIKEETEDGVAAFEGTWKQGGLKHEMIVKPDGTVISQEQVITLEAAPAPVQAAIKAAAANGKIEKIEKETNQKGTFYEAEIESNESDIEVIFDDSGKEISRKIEKEDEDDKPGKDKSKE